MSTPVTLTGTRGVGNGGASTERAAPRVAPLLPECGDLQAGLFAAQALLKNARSKVAIVSADAAQTGREHALEQAREAVRRAQEEMKEAESKAEWIKGLRTVATVAAVVVAAASVVCTAGLSAPGVIALAGVALSASSSYIGEAAGSEELALALAVAGALMSCGAGMYSALTSSAAANTMNAAQQAVVVGGRVAGGTAEIASGSLTIAKGHDEADAQEARADETVHRAQAQREQAMVDDAIALLNDVETKSRRAVMSVMGIGDSIASARMQVINNVRRV